LIYRNPRWKRRGFFIEPLPVVKFHHERSYRDNL